MTLAWLSQGLHALGTCSALTTHMTINQWINITQTPFVVRKEPPNRSRVQCKVCYFPLICLAICCARIMYFHPQHNEMWCTCIHLQPPHVHCSVVWLSGNGFPMCRWWGVYTPIARKTLRLLWLVVNSLWSTTSSSPLSQERKTIFMELSWRW